MCPIHGQPEPCTQCAPAHRSASLDEIAALRGFRWNVLQAYNRNGYLYLEHCVETLIERQGLDVAAILSGEAVYGGAGFK